MTRRLVRLFATLLAVAAVLTVTAPAGGAPPPHQVITVSQPVDGLNPCTGEPFSGTETIRFVSTFVTSPSGDVTHGVLIESFRFEAVSPSGARYVGLDLTPFQQTFVRTGADIEEVTGAFIFHVIGTGEQGGTPDDFYEQSNFVAHFDLSTFQLIFFQSHDSFACK
jgi:hypothetical protein